MKVEGKVCFVSGANRGIGKAITEELLANGAARVYAGARDVSSLSEMQAEHGDKLVPVQLDVTDEASVKAAAKTDVDILINNAGVLEFGNFSNNLMTSMEKNMDVNLWGVLRLTEAMLPSMKDKEAVIAIVSSMVGLANMPSGLTYSISKAAAHSATQGLRGELAGSKILVTGIYPGPIDTDMTKDFDMPKDSPELVAQNVIKGIEAGDEYIFPDSMSQQMGALYMKDPKTMETEFSKF